MVWYLYRLPGKFTGWRLTTALHEFCDELNDRAKALQVRQDYILCAKTAKRVGWDGTTVGEPCVFPLVTAFGMTHAFVWKQKQLGLTFVASPEPLAYMHEDVDWDARTDSEEKERAKKALQGIDPTEKVPAKMFASRSRPWTMSAKGNPWRKINGFLCTVFAKNGEYGGIISDPETDKKVWTKKCPTQQEVMDYIDENWPELTETLDA